MDENDSDQAQISDQRSYNYEDGQPPISILDAMHEIVSHKSSIQALSFRQLLEIQRDLQIILQEATNALIKFANQYLLL